MKSDAKALHLQPTGTGEQNALALLALSS